MGGVVESVGSPRDGDQVARLRLLVDAGEVAVAATLPAYPAVTAGDRSSRSAAACDRRPTTTRTASTCAGPARPGSLDARALRVVATPAGSRLQAARDAAGDALRRALPEPEAGLAAGILVGLRERVDRTLAADFATAGVSHVVAISGWNIAIVAGLVAAALRGTTAAARGDRRSLVTVVAYVVAAGASPSVVRAAVMAGVVLLARESRTGRAGARRRSALAAVAPAARRPGADRRRRVPPVGRWRRPGCWRGRTRSAAWLGGLGGGRMPRWLAESLGISLAAQAATLPDVLATFGRLSLVAPVVNLAVVPAGAGGDGGRRARRWPAARRCSARRRPWPRCSGLPGWLVLHVVVAIVRIARRGPVRRGHAAARGGAQRCGGRGRRVVLAGPGASARLRRRRRRAGARAGPAASANGPQARGSRHAPRVAGRARSPARSSSRSPARPSATRPDARPGSPCSTSGRATRSCSRPGPAPGCSSTAAPIRTGCSLALDERIPPWDRRLDVVVLTHPHEDHVAGLARILERYARRARVRARHARARARAGRPGTPSSATGRRAASSQPARGCGWARSDCRCCGRIPGTVPLEPSDTGTADQQRLGRAARARRTGGGSC